MDSRVIDVLFDRAVEIVQSLPKTGPIQTGYEEKLSMYSLYKQATVGNVKGSRPAMWDMLGRAKWDAWAKHKDLGSHEAKWLYVEELLRVLRKYPDNTVVRDLIAELQNIDSGTSDILMSGSFSKTHESDSDSDSDDEEPSPRQMQSVVPQMPGGLEDSSEVDNERANEMSSNLRGHTVMSNPNLNPNVSGRPQSSLSTHRYRTPMGGSVALSPPPGPSGPAPVYASRSGELLRQRRQQMPEQYGAFVQSGSVQYAGMGGAIPGSVPHVQPMPGFETPSAFPGPSPPVSSTMIPSVPALSSSAGSSFANVAHPYPENMYPGHPEYHAPSHHSNSPGQLAGSAPRLVGGGVTGSSIRSPLERAIENVQTHLTALQERMDIFEGRSVGGTPYASLRGPGGGPQGSPLGSPYRSYFGSGGRGRGYEGSIWTWLSEIDVEYFGWEHMGLWSTVLSPLARLTKFLGRILAFLMARRDADGSRRGLSPGMAILRRLLLDASFVLLAVYVTKRAWRRTGMRRREVVHAMKGVWHAIVGQGSGLPRHLVEKGV